MKRTYMVAVKVRITPVVYVEVVAKSAKDAVAQVELDRDVIVSKHMRSFISECATDLTDADPQKDVSITSAGKADQYHTESECKLCQQVNEDNEQQAKQKTDEYYIQLARDEYGNAVRDNARAELIEIGKTLEDK